MPNPEANKIFKNSADEDQPQIFVPHGSKIYQRRISNRSYAKMQ